MNIQMVDLQSQYLRLKQEIDEGIQEVIMSTAFIKGQKVALFEEKLATYLKVKYVVSCGNGTDAIQIALMSLDLEKGSEVIIPAFSYVAAAEVAVLLGLVPVFVDVNIETFNIDFYKIEDAISSKTKAIIPVHLFGQSCDMEPILKIAKKYGLYVIEDNAQAIGAVYTFSDGSKMLTGTMGHIGTTSFFPSKNLGCFGDGGAIITNDSYLAEKIRMICNHGQRQQYYHDCVGVNSRLDTIQAAILLAKLPYLNDYNLARQSAATNYNELLKDLNEVICPITDVHSTHVYHQYTIKLKGRLGSNRNQLRDYLKGKGIPTMVYYPLPLHLQNAYKDLNKKDDSFQNAVELCDCVLSLPMHPELTPREQEIICSFIKDYISNILFKN